MGRTACTGPQCLYKGALFFYITEQRKHGRRWVEQFLFFLRCSHLHMGRLPIKPIYLALFTFTPLVLRFSECPSFPPSFISFSFVRSFVRSFLPSIFVHSILLFSFLPSFHFRSFLPSIFILKTCACPYSVILLFTILFFKSFMFT